MLVKPMEVEAAEQLPKDVLFRISRGDAKGRAYGTPRNPHAPTITEFKPRLAEVSAALLEGLIVRRKHGLHAEQEQRIGQLSNEELGTFRLEDPISAIQIPDGLSMTGGHHRMNEILKRVQSGTMNPSTIIRILLHD